MPDMTWRLMPVEATTKMWSAGNRAHTGDVGGGAYFDTTAIYNAMLTASPDPAEDERLAGKLVEIIDPGLMRLVLTITTQPAIGERYKIAEAIASAVIRLFAKGRP